MERHGQLIAVNPESLGLYKEYHRAVWPGVADKIHKCNIRNYSIYNLGDRLFAYFEYVGDDFDSDMQSMADHKETQKWWAIMQPLQRPVAERQEGEWWAEMEEVFHQE